MNLTAASSPFLMSREVCEIKLQGDFSQQPSFCLTLSCSASLSLFSGCKGHFLRMCVTVYT